MLTKNTLVRALLILMVVGILIGGGYALYRIGYAHGVRDSLQFELGRRFDPGFPRSFERNFWAWGGRFAFWPWRAIPGLLFTVAILGLVVAAAVGLFKKIQARHGQPVGPSSASEPPPTTS